MTLRDKIAGWISPRMKWEAEGNRIAEAWNPAMAGGGGVDPEEWKWRRLTQHVDRTLPAWTQERSQEVSYYLWKSNPLARRIIEVQVDHIIGDGIRVRADDPDTQRTLDLFCEDPINAFYRKLRDRLRYLTIFGEQFMPTYVHPTSGRVRLGYIDPAAVAAVVLDPDNAEIVREVKIGKRTDRNPTTSLSVVRWDDELGRRDGEVVYWSINRPPNSTRGTSDLLSMVDWLDALDQYLVGTVDRVLLQNLTFVDLEVQGADEAQLKRMQQAYMHLKPGTVRARNEKMKAQFLSPEVDGRDIADIGKILTTWCGTGAGLPPHWLGQPGDSNKATADAEGLPALRSLRSRQEEFRLMVADLLDYVLDQAQAAGTLSPNVDRSFEILMSPISVVDTARISDALVKLSAALDGGVMAGHISDDEAGIAFRYVLGQLGVDLRTVDEATGNRLTPGERVQAAARAALDIA